MDIRIEENGENGGITYNFEKIHSECSYSGHTTCLKIKIKEHMNTVCIK